MAALAAWFQNAEWLNFVLTPTYVSATQFTVAGNQTGVYVVGRRVKAFVSAGTIYGTVAVSAFTSLTTVTVTWDSGNLDSGLSEVDVGILNPAASSIGAPLTLSSSTDPALTISSPSGIDGAVIKLAGNGGTTPSKRIRASGGQLQFVNDANSIILVSVDDVGNTGITGNISASGSGFITGNITAGGNITANSDERLKTDWEMLPHNFVERLAGVRTGTYTRIDTEQRHVGVGAQSLQSLLPEAVLESDKGVLSVAYGQAALAACVELAKEVVRLRALLEPLK